MRELAVLTGELADSLKDDETGLIIKKEDRKGLKVAVIYQIGENIDRVKPPLIEDMDSQEDKDVMGEPEEKPMAAL